MKDKIFVVTCSIICVVALGISIVNFSSIRRISSSSNSVTNQGETVLGEEESSEGDDFPRYCLYCTIYP